jgi:hypothetical protein
MGTSLSGTQVKTSYVGLLKAGDNGAIGSSMKAISDGTGNDTALSISTTQVKVTNLLIDSPSSDTTSTKVLVRDEDTGLIGTRTLPIFESVTTSLTTGADPILSISDAANNTSAVTFQSGANVSVSAASNVITFSSTLKQVDFVDTGYTISAEDSGARIMIDANTNPGQTYTLPAASAGLVFEFLVDYASATPWNINAVGSDYFYGSVTVCSSTSSNKIACQNVAHATAGGAPASYNQLTLDSDAATTGGQSGSRIIITAEGDGWLVSAYLTTSNGTPGSVAAITAQ